MYASRSLNYQATSARTHRLPLSLVLVVGFALAGLIASAIAAICIPESATVMASMIGT